MVYFGKSPTILPNDTITLKKNITNIESLFTKKVFSGDTIELQVENPTSAVIFFKYSVSYYNQVQDLNCL